MLRILTSLATTTVVRVVLYERSGWVNKGSFLDYFIIAVAVLSGWLVYCLPFWDF